MEFRGLDPDIVAFYGELRENNGKAWWLANKARYEERVRGPVLALADELGAEFGPLKIFRPYRDVRFSSDKSPYKDHLGLVSTGPGAVHYLQFGDEGMMVAGGVYDTSPARLAAFRELVVDNRRFPDLDATLDELAAKGFELTTTDALATAPRGYPADHPRIGLLRLKRLAVHRREEPADWMWTPEAADRIRGLWRDVAIWCDWLRENLPPASRA